MERGENAASRWAGLRARGLKGGEMEAEGMRGRVRNVVAMREGGVRAVGWGALGVRGAARSGRGSHLSHGRPGREVEDGRLADDDTDKRVGRVWRTKKTPLMYSITWAGFFLAFLAFLAFGAPFRTPGRRVDPES